MNAGARAGIAVGVVILLLAAGGAAFYALTRRAAEAPPAAAPPTQAAAPEVQGGPTAEAYTETPAMPEPTTQPARTPKPRPSKAPAATAPPAAATPPPTPPPPPPLVRFESGPALALRVKGNIKDLGSLDLSSPSVQRTPENPGRLEFDVVPEEVEAGNSFSVKVYLANQGHKTIKFKDALVTLTIDGSSSQRAMGLRAKEAKEGQRVLLDELSGGWPESQKTWAIDVKVLAKNGDLYYASLKGAVTGRGRGSNHSVGDGRVAEEDIEGFEKGTLVPVHRADKDRKK